LSTYNVGFSLLAFLWNIFNNKNMEIETFAQRLKKLRKKRGLTQDNLARTVGMSRFTVMDWESGKRTPSTGDLILIAKALETSISYLLGESDIADVAMGKVRDLMEAITTCGAKIKALREKTGMSLEALAEKVNITLSDLKKIEEGTKPPSITDVREILSATDSAPEFLLNDPSKGLYVTDNAFKALDYAITWHKEGIDREGLEISAMLLKEAEEETTMPRIKRPRHFVAEVEKNGQKVRLFFEGGTPSKEIQRILSAVMDENLSSKAT
jgi:transcriptional regulator with XRE-family HTH domain